MLAESGNNILNMAVSRRVSGYQQASEKYNMDDEKQVEGSDINEGFWASVRSSVRKRRRRKFDKDSEDYIQVELQMYMKESQMYAKEKFELKRTN